MEKIPNVWIRNVYYEFEDPSNAKEFVQVPKAYNRSRKLFDEAGNPVVDQRTGKQREVPDVEMVDCNTYHAVRHIANVAINVAPLDERTGRPKIEPDDTKFLRRALKELKQLNKLDPEVKYVLLEKDTHAWVVKMCRERGKDIFAGNADEVLEALEAVAKDPSDIPKPVVPAEKGNGGEVRVRSPDLTAGPVEDVDLRTARVEVARAR